MTVREALGATRCGHDIRPVDSTAVAIFLAAQSLLFSFQTLAVLLAWLAGEGGFGGATDQGAFGPSPTSLPLAYEDSEFWSYGLVNLVIVVVGVLVVVAVARLRARRVTASGPLDAAGLTTSPR